MINKQHSNTLNLLATTGFLLFILLISLSHSPAWSANDKSTTFANTPTVNPIVNPKWFKVSFLEINDDIADARKAGKKGILLYFGQKRCPYCKLFLDNNYSQKNIVSYTQKYFDVIAINVRGNKTVVNMTGKSMTEKQFAISEKAELTPTLLFIDTTGKRVLKLIGYQSPKRYSAAMAYMVESHYKTLSFKAYLKSVPASSKNLESSNATQSTKGK
ncbi:thioredoxin SoxW [hydrothermal vent metagenome]|uniref:Thioredoxin SoxW n=1 Tax=hydrothermal vent metagenome TaxID=652676 RepID=A0A3B0YK47_9ZZZZ